MNESGAVPPVTCAKPDAVDRVGHGALAARELQWQHPHANEVAAMDTFKALGDYSLDAQ